MAEMIEHLSRGKVVYLRNEQIKKDRETWIPAWKDVTNYILPNYGKYVSDGDQPNDGSKKTQKIYDGTATRSVRIISAGMQGGLTSPARKWFKLGIEDLGLMKYGPVKSWIEEVERRMYVIFARSNFYSAIHSIYTELAGFSTACLFIEEDPVQFIRCRVMTAGEYGFSRNEYGRLDTVYLEYWLQAKQVAQKFGMDRLSDIARRKAERTPFEYIRIIHAIQPRITADITKLDALSMPFESVYIEYDQPDNILRESGFREFPAMGPRWNTVSSDIYGRGLGMDALPDVKMLQEMVKTTLRAMHKQVDPPMRVPSSYNRKLKMFPRAVNKVDSNNNEAVSKLFDFTFDIMSARAAIKDVQMAIQETFFYDLFRLIADSGVGSEKMTATEVLEKKEEKLILLGPVVERQINELLDPAVDRTFAIGLRNFWFPPVPKELEGMELKTEYISVLAQAQRATDTHAIDSTIQFVGNVANMYPQALDKINIDATIDERVAAIGAPVKILYSDDMLQEIRRAKAEEAQAQADMEQAAMAVQSAKSLGDTNIRPDQALGQLMETFRP